MQHIALSELFNILSYVTYMHVNLSSKTSKWDDLHSIVKTWKYKTRFPELR